MTASVTEDVAEESLYSQACCISKLYLVAKVWCEGGERRFHLVGRVEWVLRRYLISFKTAGQRLMRIQRLNMVIDVVKKRIRKKGYVVLNKPRVVSHEKDQLLRPGLCAKKDSKAMVLNAHVPHETLAKRLAIARNDKIKKYASHGDGFRRYLGCDDLKLDVVVVGARRAIIQQMAAKLLVLGLGPEEMDLMQKRAVEGSQKTVTQNLAEELGSIEKRNGNISGLFKIRGLIDPS